MFKYTRITGNTGAGVELSGLGRWELLFSRSQHTSIGLNFITIHMVIFLNEGKLIKYEG